MNLNKMKELRKKLGILSLALGIGLTGTGCGRDDDKKPTTEIAIETTAEPTTVAETTARELTASEKGQIYLEELLKEYNKLGYCFDIDDVKVSRYYEKNMYTYEKDGFYTYNYHLQREEDPNYEEGFSYVKSDDIISIKVNMGTAEEPYYESIAALLKTKDEKYHNIYMVCRDEYKRDHYSRGDSLVLDEDSDTFSKLRCISYFYSDYIKSKASETKKSY